MARAHTAEATHTVDDGGKPGFLSRYAGRTRRPGGSRWGGREMWRRGWVLAVLALLLGLAFILHSEVPNSIGNVGSLWETFLPWGGLLIIGLLGLALLRRAPWRCSRCCCGTGVGEPVRRVDQRQVGLRR